MTYKPFADYRTRWPVDYAAANDDAPWLQAGDYPEETFDETGRSFFRGILNGLLIMAVLAGAIALLVVLAIGLNEWLALDQAVLPSAWGAGEGPLAP